MAACFEDSAGRIEPAHEHEVGREMLGQVLCHSLDGLIDFDVPARFPPDPQQ